MEAAAAAAALEMLTGPDGRASSVKLSLAGCGDAIPELEFLEAAQPRGCITSNRCANVRTGAAMWECCGLEHVDACDEHEWRNTLVSAEADFPHVRRMAINLCASDSARHNEPSSRAFVDFKFSMSTSGCETLPCNVSISTNFSESCWGFSWNSCLTIEIPWRISSTGVDSINESVGVGDLDDALLVRGVGELDSVLLVLETALGTCMPRFTT